ncbi:MAG TPA: four helix bundle protein [Anaerolineales bacterium]|nr:four helix bundle protein [Anaerolineales bacterium]
MATVKNFEDLKVWQKARDLAGCVYALTRKEKFSRDFGLRDQIQKAAGSVMHNIAEGFEAVMTLSLSAFSEWLASRQVKFNRNFILHLIQGTLHRKS